MGIVSFVTEHQLDLMKTVAEVDQINDNDDINSLSNMGIIEGVRIDLILTRKIRHKNHGYA